MRRAIIAVLGLAVASATWAGGRLIGNARYCSGVGMKEHWLYLQKEGQSGAHAGYTPDDGWYSFATVAAGNYCLFDTERYIGNVYVPEGGIVRYDLIHDADFWTSSGPEYYGHEFGQTFVAIGPYIKRIWIDVGNMDRVYVVTVHEGGRGGPQVGPTKTVHRTSAGPLNLTYFHGEMPVIPGQTYYVKVVSDIGAVICLKCVENNEYPYGEAYIDGVPQAGLDFRAEINSERRGLIFNHPSLGSSYDGICSRSLGQTITATGTSIVAVIVRFTYGSEQPPVGVEVSVWEGFYGGNEIAPRKSIGGWNDFMHGVGWRVGECPVVPGQQYYIRWTRRYLETWFLAMYTQADVWPDGCVWVTDEEAHPEHDAGGVIIEHTGQDFIDFSQIRATQLGESEVSVKWVTSVPSSSQVRWEIDGVKGMSPLDQTNVTEHEVILSGLPAGETLTYSVRSWAQGWLESESDTYSLPLGAGGTRSFALGEGWSLIGYASPGVPAPQLSECRVTDGVQTKTWDEAVASSWVQDGLFYYDGGSYKLVKTSGGDTDSLESGRGYWVLNQSGGPLSLLTP